ncbi:glycosyl transferase [Campylobacter sp. 19-13652]|nr:glycosyl transferase [Campylobacter sp. 19-13652]
MVIQSAKIGDYANSSVLFEPLCGLDVVIDEVNLAFANHDSRINKAVAINRYKKGLLAKLRLAFMLYFASYERVYVLLPNSLNLFLARFAMPRRGVVTVYPKGASKSVKILSLGMQKIPHSTENLTLLTYLKMVGVTELKYKKQLQKPLFIPQDSPIKNSDKFRVGISFSAANKIKTPPAKTWQIIFDILKKIECEIYIFGVKDDDKMLKELDISGLNLISLVGRVGLEALPYEIGKMGLYISSDTGNYYIADTMGVSTVVLMGPCFASEQRGVGDTLIVAPVKSLKPFTSVFATVTDRNCPEYYELDDEHIGEIEEFVRACTGKYV